MVLFFHFILFSFSPHPISLLILFTFHHEHIHSFFRFIFPFVFILISIEEFSFTFFTTDLTLPSLALPENRLGIALCYNGDRKGYIEHIEYICGVIQALEVVSKPYLSFH